MKNLLKRVAEISDKYEQLNKISGNAFNVFNVINVTSDEVRLHSRFLAELLNPKGSHGQEHLFLQLFTEQLEIDLDYNSATINVEKHIGTKKLITGGYIDIYIKDSNGKSIIIENKIYARDQESQLLRYYNYNNDNLLYLNLDGNEPSEDSYTLSKEQLEKLPKDSKGKIKLIIDTDFKVISYKNDIIEWLVKCREKSVEFPLLREGITHYINLIKTLTGQTGINKMNKEITNYITSDINTLKQAVLIEENMNSVKIKVQWNFWECLKKGMTEKGLKIIEEASVTFDNVKNYYNKSRNRDLLFGFLVKIYEKDNMSIHFKIELNHSVYFGFTLEKDGQVGISNLDENAFYKNLVLELNPNYKNEQFWLGWRHTEEILNFRNFNSDIIFELTDNKLLENRVKKIVEDVIIDIEELKNKLKNL